MVLSSVSDIAIAGFAENGEELFEKLVHTHTEVDVLLLDLHMPNFDPATFLQCLHATRPEIRVLAITGAPDAPTINTLLRHGLRGCILKTPNSDILVPIRMVARGQYHISPETQELLFEYQQYRDESTLDLPVDLSQRDRELLIMLARGDSNDQIANHFGISRATTNNYTSRLYSTLGLKNRAQATNWAIRYGVISVEEVKS